LSGIVFLEDKWRESVLKQSGICQKSVSDWCFLNKSLGTRTERLG